MFEDVSHKCCTCTIFILVVSCVAHREEGEKRKHITENMFLPKSAHMGYSAAYARRETQRQQNAILPIRFSPFTLKPVSKRHMHHLTLESFFLFSTRCTRSEFQGGYIQISNPFFINADLYFFRTLETMALYRFLHTKSYFSHNLTF